MEVTLHATTFGQLARTRILLVTHRYPPHHTAGVEQYARQIALALHGRAEVVVATTRKIISLPTGTIRRRIADGLPVIEVANNLVYEQIDEAWNNQKMEAAFATILDETKPDLVHFQHLLNWSAGCLPIARERELPVFVTLHDYWLMCFRFGQMVDHLNRTCPAPSRTICAPCMAQTKFRQPDTARPWVSRLIAFRRLTKLPLDGVLRFARRFTPAPKTDNRNLTPAEENEWGEAFERRSRDLRAAVDSATRLLTPSRTLERAMIAWGIETDRIVQLPQGLDHTLFEGVPPIRRAPRLRIAYVGQIAPHKGVHVLIDAVQAMDPESVELTVCGSSAHFPDYGRQLASQVHRSHRIRFTGPVSRTELVRLYGDFDVLCVPSLWNECCPLTIQESQMAGRPCVVSALGGMAELVRHDVDGLQVPPGDVEAWTAALERLVDEPELLSRLAASAPPVPTIDEHVDALLEIYGATAPLAQ